MRVLSVGKCKVQDELVEYFILAQGYDWGENYGILVIAGEDRAEITEITSNQEKVLSLVERLIAGFVTPTTLHDVVDDWLIE